MHTYALTCCSTADLSAEHFAARDISYVCFHFTLDGVTYPDDKLSFVNFAKNEIVKGEYPDGLWK